MNKELYDLSYSLRKEVRNRVLFVILVIVAIYVAMNLVLTFVIFPARQTSVSMTGDTSPQSCIMFTPLVHSFGRGSVVLVKPRRQSGRTTAQAILDTFILFITGRQLSIDSVNNFVGDAAQTRRVVGVPGDTIYMRDYVLYIQPRDSKYYLTEFELVKHPYKTNINTNPGGWDNALGVTGSFEKMTLGADEYFLLADTRNSAIDSRLWGPLTSRDILARALFCYFPLNHIRIFL